MVCQYCKEHEADMKLTFNAMGDEVEIDCCSFCLRIIEKNINVEHLREL